MSGANLLEMQKLVDAGIPHTPPGVDEVAMPASGVADLAWLPSQPVGVA